jgi:uncharacterized RDD family membrane protein YckC
VQEYHDHLTISTPEAVDVVLDLAGPGTRISSGAIDLLGQALIAALAGVALAALADPLGPDWTVVLAAIGGFALLFLYDVAWELLNDGRTPGKALLGLRVVRDDGRRVDGASSVLRNLLRLVELPLAYTPGIVMVTLTRRHQRLGDLVGGTLVVREPRRASRALASSAEGAGTAAADDLRLDTAGLTDHDRSTARAFAARHATLDPDERRALATAIAAALRARLGGVPPDVADEALVLAVARGSSLRG